MSVHDVNKYARIKKILGIPEDEPIFVLRAQDKFSPAGIRNYRNVVRMGHTEQHSQKFKDWDEQLTECSQEFLNWQESNSDRVKEPD